MIVTAFLAVVFTVACGSPAPAQTNSTASPTRTAATADLDPTVLAAAEPVATAPATPAASTTPGRQSARVVRVVDGDTIDVDILGVTQRVRYIGMDTPETVDPRRPV
ncbi:MAG TPA: hypothetical protein VFY10_13600, partial [Dehalococcoidia bacterium]|nr:hypothetical protein [Dehalococcoidia bacterium]